MNTVEILKGAKALLETKGWTQGAYARGKSGRVVKQPRNAVCFCGIGAISVAAGGNTDDDLGYDAYKALERIVGSGFPHYNDAPGRTKEEVLAVFDKAIAAEEGRVDAA